MIEMRDAALIALAYDSMARRSELAAMDVRHIEAAEDGTATALIASSKTDQDGCHYRVNSCRRVASIEIVALGPARNVSMDRLLHAGRIRAARGPGLDP